MDNQWEEEEDQQAVWERIIEDEDEDEDVDKNTKEDSVHMEEKGTNSEGLPHTDMRRNMTIPNLSLSKAEWWYKYKITTWLLATPTRQIWDNIKEQSGNTTTITYFNETNY